MKRLLLLGFLASGLGACYADAGYSAGYYGPTTAVAVAGPNMVYVDGAPGVQVVADYDYPVFYSDGMYWRQDGGIWYSSRWHDRGWGRSYSVPVGVRGIQRPEMYRHYRGNGNYVRGGGGYRGAPVERDHRTERYESRPVVRDHRTERNESRPVVRDHRH